MLDWPRDVEQLANHLGIDRFAVMGHSGGGPYALACAHALPERVRMAVVLSGAGPSEAPNATEGMILLHMLAFRTGRYLPWWLLRIAAWRVYSVHLAALRAGIDREAGKRVPADQALYDVPEIRRVCDESEIEGLRPGLKGVAWDVRVLTRAWGFSLCDIGVPVQVWHGTSDDQTSVAMARHMAAEIPSATCRICDGEAHLLLFPHWEEILAGARDGEQQ
jgi:pimeloyl-ACP methyl ester carboxylesterase